MKTIVTHGANFHSDDIFAVATLITLLERQGYSLKGKGDKKIQVVRSLEPEKFALLGGTLPADFIVDIGKQYAPKKGLFDHHQQGGAGIRENGVPYASFGLVWKQFGKELCYGSKVGAEWIDRHIVQGIDAMDSGMYLYTPLLEESHPFLFEEYFSGACDVVKSSVGGSSSKSSTAGSAIADEKAFYKEFMRLVDVACDVLRIFIEKSKGREVIIKDAKRAYMKAKDKRIVISDHFIPTRFEEFRAPEYIEPWLFVYPNLRGQWSAKNILKNGQSYDARFYFPKSWRGAAPEELTRITGVSDALFCHNSGFLAVAASKEGILKMVEAAFKQLGIK